jgi:D-aspartate ligase
VSSHKLSNWVGRPPALVLGGLTLTRPLGMAGIPVVVATADPESPALASRYCHGYVALPGLTTDPQYLATVLGAGRALAEKSGCRVPLYFGSDDELWFVTRNEKALSPYYSMLLNHEELALDLMDSERFLRMALQRGLPVPRTYSWDGKNAPAIAEAPGAVIVKPTSKENWSDSPVYCDLFQQRGKALVFESAREMLDNPLVQQLHGLLMFQDYIPGDDSQIYSFHGFADEASRLLAGFVGRKIRTFPSHTGESSYLELVSGAGAFEKTAQGIVENLQLRGVFKMDFKRDPGSGRYYLLEINARYNLWHQLGAANGLNLPKVAYDYLVNADRSVRRTVVIPKYRWLNFSLDYRAFRDAYRRKEIGLVAWARSLLGARKVYRLFSYSDPLPFLNRYLPRLVRRRPLWRFTG